MSNFLLRVVLECFSSDLENGTHLKLNNHLYQAECQKQNLLHLPMLKLIPVPLGDRLYPPVLPEYQISTMAPARGCSAFPARGRGGSRPSPSPRAQYRAPAGAWSQHNGQSEHPRGRTGSGSRTGIRWRALKGRQC